MKTFLDFLKTFSACLQFKIRLHVEFFFLWILKRLHFGNDKRVTRELYNYTFEKWTNRKSFDITFYKVPKTDNIQSVKLVSKKFILFYKVSLTFKNEIYKLINIFYSKWMTFYSSSVKHKITELWSSFFSLIVCKFMNIKVSFNY